MRFKLPWYDVNYFYHSDLRTPADKKVKELNDFLEKNGIKWWIKPLNNGAVLEIDDDSISPEKLGKIKRMALELLRIMWVTESQLVDVFKDEIDKEKEIDSIKETIANLETSISGMNPQTPEEWRDLDNKAAILKGYREKLLHLTHSEEEIKQMEIDSIKETIANLETSISGMNPQTPEEWRDLDNKAAILKGYREKLQHLIHNSNE